MPITMKALACLFASTAVLAFGQPTASTPPPAAAAPPTMTASFQVPERTATQKHRSAINASVSQVCLGIAYAKGHGSSVDDYAKFCGDQIAPQWNKEAGFAGFVRGMLFNVDLYRREGDPTIQILAQSDAMIQFKGPAGTWLEPFKNGPYYGVTMAEFQRFSALLTERIAAELGCTCHMEWQGDFVTYTLAQRAPAST